MFPAALTIDNLMRVTLLVLADELPPKESEAVRFEFIFGIGPGGITPLEKALHGKGPGERVELALEPGQLAAVLGHLQQPFCEQTGIGYPSRLQLTIFDVVRSDDREVVKAMASGGSCSECDCGCGGH